jgi:hypothetical protein
MRVRVAAAATRVAGRWAVTLAAGFVLAAGSLSGATLAAEQGESTPPGTSAPAEVVGELRAALAQAGQRFEARDVGGVLAHVSDQYRTGPFTKSGIREQLVAIYTIYDAVKARIRIDQVQMVDGHAWVYSTGEVSGRLPLVGTWVVFLSWQRELEVARRETGGWRLFGYQQ